jgi:osmotically inducible lipoprotein OsmB
MRKIVSVAAIAVVAAAMGACTPREERAAGGALLGGAAGALIGGAVTGRAGGAVAGGLIGAAGGAILADSTRPRRECVRVRYDAYGNAYCTRYRRLD